MNKKIKFVLIAVFFIEIFIIILLVFKNFQKIKEILDLRLEIKTYQEQISNKETKIKELENQIQELQKNRLELETKIKELSELNRTLEKEISVLKQTSENLNREYENQKKELTKKIEELNEESIRTFLSLTSKIEQLLYTKLSLEKELERFRNERKQDTAPSNNVELEKIVVIPSKDIESPQPTGT
ncbi:MAG: hypothetical protein N2Z79_04450, partial [Candidatus Omnitrophica bacterium]|nr:hypothetical protein [Candidatus Omnitrophota bacterium]